MAVNVNFRQYFPAEKEACLNLFDTNCPEFFAPNERAEYSRFLDTRPSGYELCISAGQVVGAFGLIGDSSQHKHLNWVMLNPELHGLGIGSAIMARVSTLARASGLSTVSIAASHKSAPFFSKFGAAIVAETDHGWGPGMHRVDMELHLFG